MKKPASRLCLFLAIFTLFLISSCVPERPLEILEDAIDELQRQPDRWRGVVSGTLSDLGDMGSRLARDVRVEVEALYSRALGQTQSEAFCGEEFVGTRIRQRLQEILHDFDSSKPSPEIVPVVCISEPIEVVADRTRIVHYYGFDFKKFEEQHDFTAEVRYADSGSILPFQPFVSVATDYHLSVDVQSLPLSYLSRSRGPQLILRWGGDAVPIRGHQSELTILVPTPTPINTPIPVQTVTVQGNVKIKDDEWGTDEYGSLDIPQQTITLSPMTSYPLQFEKCVGGEVRLEMEITVHLQKDLTAEIQIEARLFEGTSCSTDDQEDRVKQTVYAVPNGSSVAWSYTLRNTETDGGDWAIIDLVFNNR